MEEVFKSIETKGMIYKVGTKGTIIGISGKILKQRENKDGYLEVTVGIGRNRSRERVHRLVAIAHIPNTENLTEVNHLDFNRKNNNVENLEWCNHSDNILYSQDRITTASSKRQTGEGNIKAKLKEEEVIEMRYLYDNKICTIKELADKFNSKWSTVNNVVKRLTWKHI